MNDQTAGVRTAGPAPEDLDALRRGLREQRAFRREQLRRLSAPHPAAPASGRGPEDATGRPTGATGAAADAPAPDRTPGPGNTAPHATGLTDGPGNTAPHATGPTAVRGSRRGMAGHPTDRGGAEAGDGAGRGVGPYGVRARAAGAVSRDRLAASARMVLADVEAALARMEEGRYGSCHLCARPIALARLTVVPQARYCGRCSHVREAGR